MTVYDRSFNGNEWFVIIGFIALHILVYFMPKIFSFLHGTVYYLFGIAVITFFDHTLSVTLWNFYDVNDTSEYQWFDFLTYIMNGPVSYFFIYLYVKLKIKGFKNLIYLLIFSCFALLVEYAGLRLGVFHFDKGYKMYWSFPLYFMMQSGLIIFHHVLLKKENNPKMPA